MSQFKHIKNVAIVGGTGHVGTHIVDSLLATGTHTITALTRTDSNTTFPPGVHVAKVNYSNESTLTAALQNQDFLIISLSVIAPKDTHSKLVHAAVKAGVQYIMPNSYTSDIADEKMSKENLIGEQVIKHCDEIRELRAKAFPMVCGHWYEWSVACGEPFFGFDVKKRSVTFFDEGDTVITTSTWAQCGWAVAVLLSLPVTRDRGGPALEDWADKPFYVSSFQVSQRGMLDSLNRVLGTGDGDWEIKKEPTGERYARGLKEMKEGKFQGFATAMYTRCFFKGGGGDFAKVRGTANAVLRLPEESLDEATGRVVKMLEEGFAPF